jgi:hypothetical protein
VIRQTLLDLVTDQPFRSDVFARGIEILTPQLLRHSVGKLRFRLKEATSIDVYSFFTAFKDIIGNRESC